MKSLSLTTSVYRAQLIINCYCNWLGSGNRVLDIGCGNGVVSKNIQQALNIKLTGCDIVDRLQTDIAFCKLFSPHKLPFPNKSFDVAMFNDALHHCNINTQKTLLKEAQRVAKKIIIFEYQPTILGELADAIVNIIHYRTFDLSLRLHPRTIKEWQTLFGNLDMKYKTREIKRPWFYPFSHIAFLLYQNKTRLAKISESI